MVHRWRTTTTARWETVTAALGVLGSLVAFAIVRSDLPLRPGFVRLAIPFLALFLCSHFAFWCARREAARQRLRFAGILSIAVVVTSITIPKTTATIIAQPGLHTHRTAVVLLALLAGGIFFLLLPPLRKRTERIDRLIIASRTPLARELEALFLAALGVRLIWALVVPPWQAPDEGAHFSYVGHIVENAELPHAPPYTEGYPTFSVEFGTSWNDTLLARISSIGGAVSPDLSFFPIEYDYQAARNYRAAADQRLNQAGATATPYPPLYYLLAAIPYKVFQNGPLLSRLYGARIVSSILGALGSVFAYLLAYQIFRDQRWGRALGLSMAFVPMYVFISGSVNNDAAMVCASTALIWLAVRAMQQAEISRRLLFTMGIVSGSIVLTKPTALAVVATTGLMLLVHRWPLLRKPWRIEWGRCYALVIYVLPIALQFIILQVVELLNNPRSATANSTITAPEVLWHTLGEYLQAEYQAGGPYFYWLMIKTFWGVFGWLEVYLPEISYTIILYATLLGILGLVLRLFVRPDQRRVMFFLLAFLIAQGGLVFLAVDYLLAFSQTGAGLGLQGRYFYPVLAPILLLLIAGWQTLTANRRFILYIIPTAIFALQCIALATVITRYYGAVIGW